MDGQAKSRPAIYTIGHSNHSMQFFVDLLRQHNIEVLVDVRSQPFSRFTPHFNSRELKEAVTGAGFKYLFMGKELGGRPEGDEFYNAQGQANYDLWSQNPLFLQGIERLQTGIAKYQVVMMCTEENPTDCHRNLLVAKSLDELGIDIRHIRADGTLQSHADIQKDRQLGLFDEIEPELSSWTSVKSIRSGSPKKAPPNSSER
jgi:uncharacterized protein (DUF488 family)